MTRPTPPRRGFLLRLAAGSTAFTASSTVLAQTKVDEADDAALALGYKHDSAKVDNKKYPQHQPEQKCNNCQFWQGKPADAWAGCSMFGRKHIAGPGWCLAYKKIG